MTKPKPWVKYNEIESNKGEFVVSPLVRGMGVTIGNSIRRVLMSSLGGYSMTGLYIDGVKHEFTTIPSVMEDVFQLISNLKKVVFCDGNQEEYRLKIEASEKGDVLAKDIQLKDDLIIVNPDAFLFEITETAAVSIEIVVEWGIGYRSIPQSDSGDLLNRIGVDSSFTPILNVNNVVENIRVGKELDFDELILTVTTNGSITPEEAVKQSSTILLNKFQLFGAINEEPIQESESEDNDDSKEGEENPGLSLSVDELELSARSSNCLKRAGITVVSELIEKDFTELLQIKNFGKKSADEINQKLQQFGLCLKGVE